jgi:hypothetical protein
MDNSLLNKELDELALLNAVSDKNHKMVLSLLSKRSVDPNIPEIRRKFPHSLLHRAVQNRDITSAKMLCEYGANLYDCDIEDRTAVDMAALFNHYQMVDVLRRFERRSEVMKNKNHIQDQSKKMKELVQDGSLDLSKEFSMANITCLEDLRKKDNHGTSGFIRLAYEGRFDKVVEIAKQDKLDKITISDLTHLNYMQMDVVTILGFNKQLDQAFAFDLWAGRLLECQAFWKKIPDAFQGQVNIKSMENKLKAHYLRSKGSGKRLRRRPKPKLK